MSRRSMLFVVHTGRRAAVKTARQLADRLVSAGCAVRVPADEAEALHCEGVQPVAGDADAAAGAELVIAFGGDGTLLRAAEFARPAAAALLGVNIGHVGFLAQADRADLEATMEGILSRFTSVSTSSRRA